MVSECFAHNVMRAQARGENASGKEITCTQKLLVCTQDSAQKCGVVHTEASLACETDNKLQAALSSSDNLIVVHLVKKFSTFVELECPLPCFQSSPDGVLS